MAVDDSECKIEASFLISNVCMILELCKLYGWDILSVPAGCSLHRKAGLKCIQRELRAEWAALTFGKDLTVILSLGHLTKDKVDWMIALFFFPLFSYFSSLDLHALNFFLPFPFHATNPNFFLRNGIVGTSFLYILISL